MNKLTILILISYSLISCTSKKRPSFEEKYDTHLFSKNKSNTEIKVIETHFQLKDSIQVNYYDDLELIGDTLILLSGSEPYLHVINTDNNRLIWAGVTHGKGPMEALHIKEINYDPASNKLDIYDDYKRVLMTISLDNLIQNNFKAASYYQIPEKVGIVIDFTPSVNYYYATGFFNNFNRIVSLPKQGTSGIKWLGSLPKPKKSFVPQVFQQAYKAYIDKTKKSNRLAIAYRYTNLLQIISSDGSIKSISRGKNYFPPKFTSTDLGSKKAFTQSKNIKFGFTDIETSPKYIYALYSGAQKGKEEAVFASYLLIFDWSGAQVLSHKLKNPAFHIIKNDKKPILYLKHPYTKNFITKITLDL